MRHVFAGCCPAGRFGRLAGRVLGILGLVLLSGCGSGEPFRIVPVSGKVTYKDGSLIQADQVVVTFIPQGVASAGKDAAAPATGDLNMADGTFSGLTTHKHLDGAILGKHKVTVQALKKGPGGVGQPIDVVPQRYTRVETTPLEVEVTGSGNTFTLEIERTP